MGNKRPRVPDAAPEEPEEEEDGVEGDVDGEAQSAAGTTKRKRKRKRKSRATGGGDEGADDTSTAKEVEDEAKVENTIYIEGISYDATEDDLMRFFQDKGCGKVTSVRMPRYQDSGRPRGYAHIDFKQPAGVSKALELDGVTMMGRYLKIAQANDPTKGSEAAPFRPKPPGCKTIFIKNLPYDVTEEVIKAAFQVFGKIASVRLAMWQHTGKQKGFAYLEFVKEEGAEIAVKKQRDIKVGGRPVYVDYEEGRPKGSFKTTDGKLWRKTVPQKQSKSKKSKE